MVKDVYYSKGLSYELALEMGFNWQLFMYELFLVTKFSWNELEAYLTEGWMIDFVTVI